LSILAKLFSKFKKSENPAFCSAVVLAAGSSLRMGGEDKPLIPLCSRPAVSYSLEAFNSCAEVAEIIVVTRSENIVAIADICAAEGFDKVTKIVAGGDSRRDSAYIGVQEVSPHSAVIAIHDAARPLITSEIVKDVIMTARQNNAAAPAVPVTDTIKRVENGVITDTPDRSVLYAVQTPQAFDASLIKAALQNALEKNINITDDCMAVENLGAKVTVCKGSADNIKLTYPTDVAVAEALLTAREELK